jgi:hypothetical protein
MPSKSKADSRNQNRKKRTLPEAAKAHQFKPGQSGNPEGRPKKFITLVSDALREKLKEIQPETQQTYAVALADKLVTAALDGELPVNAIREIVDRVEGKAKERVDFNDVTREFASWTPEQKLEYARTGRKPNDPVNVQ